MALIQLSQPATYSTVVQPICLAEEGATIPGSCYIAGWGYTEEGKRRGWCLQVWNQGGSVGHNPWPLFGDTQA